MNCTHHRFEAEVHVERRSGDDTEFFARLKIKCADCGKRFLIHPHDEAETTALLPISEVK